MDKTAIRNFAIEARKILMKSAITEAGFYGITKDGCKDPVQKGNDFEVYETVAGTENRIFGDDIKRRANLVQAIKTLGFEQVIEETAYTWFNRIIAIRFMEVNNYLPTRVRVLSSETGSGTPDIITQADTVELNLTSDELEKIQTAKRENRYDDAFRMLFIKQCNELNAILPGLFEKTDDYMELLLKITYTGDGVIRMLVDSIPEDNFNVETEGQVEIIGWMYQYYNTELKDDTTAKLKKNIKISKDRIPSATQLFTPDWIVRYMVENSIGRMWLEHLKAVDTSLDEKAKAREFGWEHYILSAEQDETANSYLAEVRKTYKDLTPQDITCIDPCMGSVHILVYMFDVLMDIYRSEGFSEREAVFDILEKNISGLDIDRRAYQLSYFALMMKARGYNRIFFRGYEDVDGNRVQAIPHVYAIEESNSIEREHLKYFGAGLDESSKNNAINQLNGLLDSMCNAKEYGSILTIENYDWSLLRMFINVVDDNGQMSLDSFMAGKSQILLKKILDVGEMLARQYEVVVTNPPYMGAGGMSANLTEYVKNNYPDSKNDLFSVFMEKVPRMTKNCGYIGMMTSYTWMCITSYSKLREYLLDNTTFISLIQPEYHSFFEEANVPICTFVIRKAVTGEKGRFLDLSKFTGALEQDKKVLEAISRDLEVDYAYTTNTSNIRRIPKSSFAYWANESVLQSFDDFKRLGEVADVKKGMSTAKDDVYLRMWFEPLYENTAMSGYENTKWYSITKGGEFKRWYGNNLYVVNWKNNGADLKNFKKAVLRNQQFYFKSPNLTWTYITTYKINFRINYSDLFTAAGPCIFTNDLLYKLAFLNSTVAQFYINMLGGTTITYEVGEVSNLPIRESEFRREVEALAQKCIDVSKLDWDDHEISWEFKVNPLVKISRENSFNMKIEDAMHEYDAICQSRFRDVKTAEERINEIFIKEYGVEGEVEKTVEDKDITINVVSPEDELKKLISYAVGCMFGRFSLLKEGVLCGDEMRLDKFVDEDNVIPINEENYFADDISEKFTQFIKNAFGEKNFIENQNYICGLLNGDNYGDAIRSFFVNDFYKYHVAMYSGTVGKRPIYWMFDSGKQGGFKCLINIHRYSPDTVGMIRSDYLTKAQSMIENALKNAEYVINTSSSAVDRAQASKKRDKYVKQLAEIKAYYPALSHIALQRISLDLDDGVKTNYEKFQGIEVSIEGEKKQKVDLLAKI